MMYSITSNDSAINAKDSDNPVDYLDYLIAYLDTLDKSLNTNNLW